MSKTKYYLVIPNLADFYSDKSCPQRIVTYFKKSLKRKEFIYPTLEKATKKSTLTDGIIELEIENEDNLLEFCKNILSLSTNEEKEKKLSSLIKTVYIKGFQLPFSELSIEKREAMQVASFAFELKHDSKLQLTQPALLYLKQIPKEIIFLLFTDHHFFLNFENWRQYNSREPQGKGCVFDLFHAMTMLSERLNEVSRTNVITLEDVKSLQKLLSESIFTGSTDDRRGIFRVGYNSFPLEADAVTVAGIKELLQRIIADNQAEGFRIGHLIRSNIVSTFCSSMSWLIRKEEPWRTKGQEGLTAKLKELEKKAITETITIVGKNISADADIVTEIINDFLTDFKPQDKVAKDNFWISLLYYYSDLSTTFTCDCTKSELQFDLKYSRDHALASAGNVPSSAANICNYTDADLENLAKKIYEEINEGKKMISLFTPEPKLAEKWANQALDKYNISIGQVKNVEQTIRVIDDLVHELEISHLFYDANCRTNYLLMNFLFLSKLIKWTTEFNPNRLDAYSSQERIMQHKQGILRTDYIIANQETLVKYNQCIERVYKKCKNQDQALNYSHEEPSGVDMDNEYEKISQQFVEKLDEFKKTFDDSLNVIIKKYYVNPDALNTTTSTIFSVSESQIEFVEALTQFREDSNCRLFFERVAKLSNVPNIAEDIKSLKVLTGFIDNQSITETDERVDELFDNIPRQLIGIDVKKQHIAPKQNLNHFFATTQRNENQSFNTLYGVLSKIEKPG